MALTIEVMNQLEQYYFDDKQLPVEYLDEIINRHRALKKWGNNVERIKDTFNIYGEYENGERGEVIFCATKRYFKIEKEKKSQYFRNDYKDRFRYIDCKNKLIRPVGDAQKHEITICGETFIFHKPIEYNLMLMLLIWSDDIVGVQVGTNEIIIDCEPICITKDICNTFGIIIDDDRKYPLAIAYCEWKIFDYFNQIDSRFCLNGPMMLYAHNNKKSELHYNRYRNVTETWACVSEIRRYSENVSLTVKMLIDEHSRSIEGKQLDDEIRHQFNNQELCICGNPEEMILYFFNSSERKGGLSLKLFSLRDYFEVAAWIVLAYKFNCNKDSVFLYEYIPEYKTSAEKTMERAHEILDKIGKERTINELRRIYIDYQEAFVSAKKLEAYLVDFIRDRRYINMLLIAYEEGIYSDLLKNDRDIIFIRSKYYKILHENYGMSEVMTNKIVNDWIDAMEDE